MQQLQHGNNDPINSCYVTYRSFYSDILTLGNNREEWVEIAGMVDLVAILVEGVYCMAEPGTQ